MHALLKRTLVACATLGVLVTVLLAAASRSQTTQTAQVANPPEVEVAQVVQQDVPIYSEWIGTLDGLVNATIRAQVTGYLLKQHASYCVPQLRYPFILCMCLALQGARRSRPSPTPTPPADTTYGVKRHIWRSPESVGPRVRRAL